MLIVKYSCFIRRGSENLLHRRWLDALTLRFRSDSRNSGSEPDPLSRYYPNTSVGIKERSVKAAKPPDKPIQTPYPPFPDGKNPKTGEVGGPVGPEPTRFGDWERKGRVTDF